MMEFISGIAVVIAVVIVLNLVIDRTVLRTPALSPHHNLLRLMFWFWAAAVNVKWFLLPDEIFSPDSLGHERISREIAEHLWAGRFDLATQYFRFGNYAYRFVVGVFYACTNSASFGTTAVNSAMAFWGLVATLEIVCRVSRATRAPAWLVVFICANPTAFFWSSVNAKEGPMLWGIAMLLRILLLKSESTRKEHVGFPALGLAVAGLLRPHIAAGYVLAIAVSMMIRQRNFKLAGLTVGGAYVSFLMFQSMAPSLVESVMREGLTETLDSYHEQRQYAGGSAMSGKPIPGVTGIIMIFFRPFPWEVFNLPSLFSGIEIWTITGILFCAWWRNYSKIRLDLAVITSFVSLLILSIFFSYMYNMGLMVRQRLMLYPVLFFLAFLPTLSPVLNTRMAASSGRAKKTLPNLRPSS